MDKSRVVLLSLLSWAIFGSRIQAEEARPEVVLIRGGAGYWPGVTALAEDLAEHGFAPTTILGALYSLKAADIAERYHSEGRCGPITVVGYSSGSDYACLLCRSLENRGVPVATLVLMESTLGTPVPGNVELCVNIYESRPHTDWIPAFRGVPVQAVGSQTEVMNLDVAEQPQLNWLKSYNHFTIASGSEARVMLRNLLLLRQSQFLRSQAHCVGLHHPSKQPQVRTISSVLPQPQPVTIPRQHNPTPAVRLSSYIDEVSISTSRVR